MKNDSPRPEDFLRPRSFSEKYPNLATLPQLRWQIFNAQTNGMDAEHVIIRDGRRMFIHVPAYMRWLTRYAGKAA